MIGTSAAILYAALTLGVVAFQVALAAGAPWGHLTMGGRYDGELPAPMRVAAVVQAGFLALLAVVVLGTASIGWRAVPTWAIWVVVGVTAVSCVLNAITPSRAERRLWLPVTLVLLAAAIVVAL